MSVTILSPHLDDAVCSLGQFMAYRSNTTVITVFAGHPERGILSPYDSTCGFESSYQAVERRRHEDVLACGSLDATAVHWDFLDHQYAQPPNKRDIVDAISALAPKRERDLLFVPLGIGHPDHRTVMQCALDAMPAECAIYVYEELPYRVDFPEEAYSRRMNIGYAGWTIADIVAPLKQGERHRKAEAIARYKSQFPEGADNPALLVAERAWRCER